MIKYVHYIVLLFSFFLGFGLFDPFEMDRLFFNLLTVLLVLSILFFTDAVRHIRLYSNELSLLILIPVVFSVANIFYEYSYRDNYFFNFKFLSAIIIFWLLSYVFLGNKILRTTSILMFSISCSLIAISYNIGLLDSYGEILNGRLRIFGENPNSISSRMAISFIILVYIMVENPLKYSGLRFFLGMFLPSLLFFVIDSGSRGSFLGLILGVGLIVFFAKKNIYTKIILIGLSIIFVINSISLIAGTGLMERFEADDVTGGREMIWGYAWEIFMDYPFGIGEAGYITEMTLRFNDYHDTHNLLLYLLVCGGVFSLILFLFFLKGLFLKSYYSFKNGNSLLIVLFGFLFFLFSKTGGVLTYLVMWYFFAVINSYTIIKDKLTVDE